MISHLAAEDPLDRLRYPLDPWKLREASVPAREELGRCEALFAVGNGYLGIRGTPPEGRDAATHGTYVNGFHETFPIIHAEEAYGYARIGQTMLNVPDATVMRLYVGGEPLLLSVADLESYERSLDFRQGRLARDLVWRTPAGVRVRVESRRMTSFARRHLAVMTLAVTPLDGDADLTVVSTLDDRLDRGARDPGPTPADALRQAVATEVTTPAFADPRKDHVLPRRVLVPQLNRTEDARTYVGYRTASSGMTIGVGVGYQVDAPVRVRTNSETETDLAVREFRAHVPRGATLRIVKYAAYHTSRSSPAEELVQRCRRTLDDAFEQGDARLFDEQRAWLDGFWERGDVQIPGQEALEQAVRFSLFHVAQASARSEGHGIPAKGLTGTGYSGHYFWDSEIYVLPFWTYTTPSVARSALRFRYTMLKRARMRARELNVAGALFPWRTIDGHEASANYAQGTAQYHIDADISYAITRYVKVSGDRDFLWSAGVDVLVETARMWEDLGFWRRADGTHTFHINGVTGPDEYTTVVNDNLFTNVMARGNLRAAVAAVHDMRRERPDAYARMCDRLNLDPDEVQSWQAAAEAMYIPFDRNLGIHPQDDGFLNREVWDVEGTPTELRPLLLHFHPLVIYRYQVIKQADVVLAELLHASEFTPEEKSRDFHYYDPLTTGDSSLSAVVQAVLAAEVGHGEQALDYFRDALYIDLDDLHGNTNDGIHIASAGGVWSTLVCGFGGMRDDRDVPSLDPRLPSGWDALVFHLTLGATRVRVEVRRDRVELTDEHGPGATLRVCGHEVRVSPGHPVEQPVVGAPTAGRASSVSDIVGRQRPDGTVIEASVPGHPLHPDRERARRAEAAGRDEEAPRAHRLVVAAAIVDRLEHPRRLLCAARSYPSELAGRFEFPGGKVEPGEDPRHALQREIGEELGSSVTLGQQVRGPRDGDWPIRADRAMRVWLAQVRAGSPAPHAGGAHSELRWVDVEQVSRLPWLSTDADVLRAVVATLRARMEQ